MKKCLLLCLCAALLCALCACGGGQADNTAAPPQEGITLVLDRPFLYGIVDLYTGVPLFLGTYE